MRSAGWKAGLLGVLLVGSGLSGTLVGTPATAAPVPVPSAPRNVTATAGLRSVSVAFAKPASDGGSRITSYRAKCTSSNGGLPGSKQGFSSPIKVIELTASKRYTCTVVAINKFAIGATSAPSPQAITLPRVPGVPIITALTPGLHTVSVSFKKPASDGGSKITSYKVTCNSYYGTRSHQGFKSPITIACVAGAEAYTCTVAAENKVGWGVTSGPSASVASLPIVPGAPAVTSVSPGPRSASVTVSKPQHDGGVRISTYRVTCTSSDGGVKGVRQAFAQPIVVTGLSPSKTYTCAVAAVNLVSVGPPSPPSSAVVPLET